MNNKLEGTMVLDGLIEGRLPADDDAEDRLREWVRFAARAGLRFNCEIDSGGFSILAENAPLVVADLVDEPTHAIRNVLAELLRVFEGPGSRMPFSTLRSVEYRPSLEVLTLYALVPDGSIDVQQREAEAKTIPPAEPLDNRTRLRLALGGLVLALLVFGLSAIFVDYGDLFQRAISNVRPIDVEEFPLDATAFDELFTATIKEVRKSGQVMVVVLTQGAAMPADDAALLAALNAADTLERRLGLEAIARGYVRCELFDEKDKFIGFADVRIEELRRKVTIEVGIPLPGRPRVYRIALRY